MFRGFNLNIDANFFTNKKYNFFEYKRIGKSHLDDQMAQYQKDLKKYVTKSGEINGTKIQSEWFPPIEADIFISHSHDDEEVACALAGWLYDTFRLKSFIDSNVWGYSKNLLQIMNDDLSSPEPYDGRTLYNYDSCNRVAQHVDAMLSIALQKMIDSVETVILINTDKSIKVHSGSGMDITYSPWIYTELICTEIVRKKPLIAYREYPVILHGSTQLNESAALEFQISYEVSLGHLIKLAETNLNIWETDYHNLMAHGHDVQKHYPLDRLYCQMCPEELKKTWEIASRLTPAQAKEIRAVYSGTGRNLREQKQSEQSCTDALKAVMEDVLYPWQKGI